MTKEQMQQLEAFVDAVGLEGVLYALGDICAAKADHIRENWQDDRTARYWDKRTVRVTRVADAVR